MTSQLDSTVAVPPAVDGFCFIGTLRSIEPIESKGQVLDFMARAVFALGDDAAVLTLRRSERTVFGSQLLPAWGKLRDLDAVGKRFLVTVGIAPNSYVDGAGVTRTAINKTAIDAFEL